MSIEIPKYTPSKPEPVPVRKEDPVARSMAKPDACAKPGTFKSSPSKGVRVRVMNDRVKIRRKRDRRDVTFY